MHLDLHQQAASLDSDVETPISLFIDTIANNDGILLESAERDGRWGRFSLVAGECGLALLSKGGLLSLDFADPCFAPLRAAPHLVIRLSDVDAEPIQNELKRLVSERGFEGRLVVLGEPGMARGDCRIEWADGGIVLNHAAIVADIEAAIARHLPAETPADHILQSGAAT